MTLSPYEIAGALVRDLGMDAGIAYAERTANCAGEKALALAYSEAAKKIKRDRDALRASCDAGSFDMGVPRA